MDPVNVEHTFVTALPNTTAMQLLAQLLSSRGFVRDGEQELAADRPDWTRVRFRRGDTSAPAYMVIHLPQTIIVEWDHGRFNIGLSIDPLRAKQPIRQQCAYLLMHLAALLQEVLTGAKALQPAVVEWAMAEQPLILPPGATGRSSAAIPVQVWTPICLGVCGIATAVGVAGARLMMAKALCLVIGLSMVAACIMLLLKQDKLSPTRVRMLGTGMAGLVWSIIVMAMALRPVPNTAIAKAPPRTPPAPVNPNPPAASKNHLVSTPKPTDAQLQAKLDRIATLWTADGKVSDELLDSTKWALSRDADGVAILTGNRKVITADRYQPPIVFRVIAMTDSTNIRLGYAAHDIIFNWEVTPDELRIDGGPVSGQHKKGAGTVPVNQWVGIELNVLPDLMVIHVDGQERFRASGDFSKTNQPLTIMTSAGATVKVKSVTAVTPEQ